MIHARGRVPRLAAVAAAGALALGLAACDPPEPQGETTGAVMPDTSSPMNVAPSAAETGVLPRTGAPPVQETPPEAQPGQAVGAPDVPVDLPEVE